MCDLPQPLLNSFGSGSTSDETFLFNHVSFYSHIESLCLLYADDTRVYFLVLRRRSSEFTLITIWGFCLSVWIVPQTELFSVSRHEITPDTDTVLRLAPLSRFSV